MRIRLVNACEDAQRAASVDTLRHGRPRVVTVDGAIVPVARKRKGAWAYLGGAYAADGTVIPESLQRFVEPYAADELVDPASIRVSGEAMYGGVIYKHFGHFLLESTARLWWREATQFDGPIVFQVAPADAAHSDYRRVCLQLSGLEDRLVLVDQTHRFDRLIVPEPALELRSHVYSVAHMPFQRMARAADAGPTSGDAERIYISRTGLDRNVSIGEELLEDAFRCDGYRIIHPERMPLAEQISATRRATAVAGVIGSGLHNVIFSEGKRVCVICRDADLNSNFPMLDRLLGNDALYIFGGSRPRPVVYPQTDPYLLDVAAIVSALVEYGWLSPGTTVNADAAALRRAYDAEWMLQTTLGMPRRKPGRELVKGLLFAAALRPGHARTLLALVASLTAARRLEMADHFALEYLSAEGWNPAAVKRIVALFRAARAFKRATTIEQNGRAGPRASAASASASY